MKKLILIILPLILAKFLNAQQIPTISQYTLNPYAINPAATGITEKLPVAFAYRKLWAGIAESPSFQYLSANMEIAEVMGVGAKLYNYQAGPIRKTGLEATYSYHISLGDAGTKLSFGLSGLIYQYYLNKSELTIENPDDAVFMGTDKMIVPDASFGTYLYNEKYFAGLAIQQLFNRNVDLKTDRKLEQKQVRHYYLHGGYDFDLSSDLQLEPSLLLKFIETGIFQADINTRLTYKDMVAFGLAYRTGDAISFQLGYKYNDFMINYAFDLTLSPLKTQTFGSHEIMLIYSFSNFLK